MKRPYAMIAGTGHATPKRAMSNHDFAAIGVDTSDEWIRERTGICERRVSAPGNPDETNSSLAARAAEPTAPPMRCERCSIIPLA